MDPIERISSIVDDLHEIKNILIDKKMRDSGFFYLIGDTESTGDIHEQLINNGYNVVASPKINGLDTASSVIIIVDESDEPKKESIASFAYSTDKDKIERLTGDKTLLKYMRKILNKTHE